MQQRKENRIVTIRDRICRQDFSGEGGEGSVYTLRVDWDGEAAPGQFFQLQPSNAYLRRPISVSDIDREEGTIDLTIRVGGKGTKELVERAIGDSVALFGPLGIGYDLAEKAAGSRFLVIGGGIGVAPQIPLIQELKRRGAFVDTVVGYREAPYLIDELLISDSLYVATESQRCYGDACEDSRFHSIYGNVSPIVEQLVADANAANQPYADVFVCGPDAMLRALGKQLLACGIDPQLLLEEHFACGVGACLVCTCEVKWPVRYARVCTDGPMFRASDLVLERTKIEPIHEPKPHQSEGLGRMEVDLNGLILKNPVTVASGTFGFGREFDQFFDIAQLGAISVKGLTLRQRDGNPGRRVVETASGMINSVGLQNPGADVFVRDELPYLRERGVPVIANINGETIEDYVALAQVIDASEVDSVELNISCPNVKNGGLSFGTDVNVVRQVVSAVRAATKKHLIVKLSPNVTDIRAIARACEEEGADALSMINTVTGMAIDAERMTKAILRGTGGLSGPAIKPIGLRCVYEASSVVRIPILGMGGISNATDAIEYLLAGASAIAVGTAMFVDPLAPIKILEGMEHYLDRKGIANIRSIPRIG
ncbi:MAG: dihydroorotate dehydrogenase [Bacillota bacterium]|nr:dihydroorotate dehydrogenase [Bacillota bacterium]